ncbi:MAG: BrnA antitoxin family protein [Zoogloeaceae bacterium]|jgi:predicted DNA binding CopG/RHH family protein|nr:BrnA antitoxin family protein [Zoogloeaceae bacterium]
MKTSTDPLYERYANLDFSTAKPVHEIAPLARLQAEAAGRSSITIRVKNSTLAAFKARAAQEGGAYQTMMNEALDQFAQGFSLADLVRETIRQELHSV